MSVAMKTEAAKLSDAEIVEAYLIASIYAARKDPDRAFGWLDRALRQRDGDLLFIRGDRMISNLVADPRYQALMQKMQKFN